MTISMGIKHEDSGAYEVVPIATSQYFEQRWLPACAHLGLRYVPHFHDGSLSALSAGDLGEVVKELEMLRAWATTNDPFMTERIDGVLRALHGSASIPCVYDFG
ncbi:MAG: hypothetical protein U0359_15780 [Byssovorax sp.]